MAEGKWISEVGGIYKYICAHCTIYSKYRIFQNYLDTFMMNHIYNIPSVQTPESKIIEAHLSTHNIKTKEMLFVEKFSMRKKLYDLIIIREAKAQQIRFLVNGE